MVLLFSSVIFNRGLAARWLIFLLTFLFVLAPWSARNYRLWGTLKPCSVGTGYGFFVTGNMAAGLSFDESFRKYLDKLNAHPEPRTFVPGAPAAAMVLEGELQTEGNALLKANPAAFMKIALRRLPPFWFTSHSSVFGVDRSLGEYLREKNFLPVAVRLGLLGLQAALLALAAAGIWFRRKNWRETAPLIALPVFFTGHVLFDFVPRYHLPVMPCILIFAAAGLADLIGRRGKTA